VPLLPANFRLATSSALLKHDRLARSSWLHLGLHCRSSLYARPGVTALSTAVLALSTIGLWLSTRRLWRVTGIAAQHIPRVERAYVSGGAAGVVDAPHDFGVTINNYGKTPAFIGTIWANIVPEEWIVSARPDPSIPEQLKPFETKKLMSFWPFASMLSAIAGMPVRDDESLWSFR
jgi:hypothetical protein